MSLENHIHCDYCGEHIGHKEAYGVREDKNEKHWCGECTRPDYATHDPEMNDIGQNQIGLVRRPGFWEEHEVERKLKYWSQKDYWKGEEPESSV